ncbi:ABC-F family ATP-binding cassette domain-containing protein [Agromyces soli]|uniref:ATP-binding cassette domain-containing protein n=1 Tax=Agromyces soli TaxID=659012 RepID=A0ABY4ANS6_9MICO|nr:ATP-binding cassette domain-containing protein [Agromyces soli]UOE24812.1 ATP-binding cassette domain-containing protein [Agromyces soli]
MTVHHSTNSYLRAEHLSAGYADRDVLRDLDFTVSPGQRLGLIGENGVGKSTLLRVLAGEAPAQLQADGRLTRPARIGLLLQELPFADDERIDDVIEARIAEVRGIERELDAAAAALVEATPAAEGRYAAALDAAERAEVWSVDARRDELLDGLGVSGIGLDRRIGEMSGGQRSRFALAALLLGAPDALLLDEPTNHLDDTAAEFLEARLRAWRGPVVFASHDREFLDRVATGLLDLDPAQSAAGVPLDASGGTVFGGSFSAYLDAKADARVRWQRQYEAEQGELRALREAVRETARNVSHRRGPTDNDKFITKFKQGRTDSAIARRVHNAELRLETLEREQLRKPPAALEFTGIPTGAQALGEEGGPLIQLAGATVGERLRLETFRVEALDRVLITGANGAGKSTLLGLLAGRIAPDAGTVRRRRGLRVGLLEQDVRFEDPDASPRALYERVLGEQRAALVPLPSLGLVPRRDLDRPIGGLSVGQQRRLALALVIAKPPHVFLLDEPTNHLSLALATELEAALGGYPGAVLIASHDRWMRRRWAGEELRLAAGRPLDRAAV